MITFAKLGQMGRFGNQLFQVASTIGIAEKNNQEWAIPGWDHPFTTKFPEVDGRRFRVKKIQWGYSDVTVNRDVSIHGYLQSEKYFKHCEGLIRDLFTMDPPEFQDDFIAVHVRRGDYDGVNHTLLGREYYDHAFSLLPNLPRIVFTDDTRAARELIQDPEMILSRDVFGDFNLMTRGSHHIIANSSFSWWGAWLANSGRVIAPKDWFGQKKKHWSTKDIYSPNWIVI